MTSLEDLHEFSVGLAESDVRLDVLGVPDADPRRSMLRSVVRHSVARRGDVVRLFRGAVRDPVGLPRTALTADQRVQLIIQIHALKHLLSSFAEVVESNRRNQASLPPGILRALAFFQAPRSSRADPVALGLAQRLAAPVVDPKEYLLEVIGEQLDGQPMKLPMELVVQEKERVYVNLEQRFLKKRPRSLWQIQMRVRVKICRAKLASEPETDGESLVKQSREIRAVSIQAKFRRQMLNDAIRRFWEHRALEEKKSITETSSSEKETRVAIEELLGIVAKNLFSNVSLEMIDDPHLISELFGWDQELINKEFGDFENAEEIKKHLICRAFSEYAKHEIVRGVGLKEIHLSGIHWLSALKDSQIGGVLADQDFSGMYTLIAAWLGFLVDSRRISGPILLIAKNQELLESWEPELSRQAPELKLLIHSQAMNRERFRQKRAIAIEGLNYQVLLTTEDLLLKDHASFSKTQWSTIISTLDGDSFTSVLKVLSKGVHGQRLIIYRGIWADASPKDLISMAQFLFPNESFQLSANVLSDADIRALKALVGSVSLRRSPSESQSLLPADIERVILCPLSGPQQFFYENLSHYIVPVHNRPLDYRKVCGHPFVFYSQLGIGPIPVDQEVIRLSGKIHELDQLLPKLRLANQRVLFFARIHYVMDALEAFFQFRDFPYVRLDGSVKKEERFDRWSRFNDSLEFQIMLVSARFGVDGLGPGVADTCIVYETEYSGADERAIAQLQSLCPDCLVVRLVTPDTIEEENFKERPQPRRFALLTRGPSDSAASDLLQDSVRSLSVDEGLARSNAELRRLRGAELPSEPLYAERTDIPSWAIRWWESKTKRSFEWDSYLTKPGSQS